MRRKLENSRKLGKEPVILKWQECSGECVNWACGEGENKARNLFNKECKEMFVMTERI
jgi:hypothetical protein